jgi:heme-degrading monooxygenase HmoA
LRASPEARIFAAGYPPRKGPIQAEHGVHAHQVLRSIENPTDVIVTHTFDSREAASAFFAMPELKEAMSQAGVNADSVEISYFDEVETGTLVGV